MLDPKLIDLSLLPQIDFSIAGSKRSAQILPDAPGVYFCVKPNKIPAYIGESVSIQKRWIGGHDFAYRCEKAGVTHISWMEVPDISEDKKENKRNRVAIEDAFIYYYLPQFNKVYLLESNGGKRQPQGIEVEVLRLERWGDPESLYMFIKKSEESLKNSKLLDKHYGVTAYREAENRRAKKRIQEAVEVLSRAGFRQSV